MFISWIIMEIRNAPHRRFKQRAVNRAVLNHSDQLATHILKTITSGEVPSCN